MAYNSLIEKLENSFEISYKIIKDVYNDVRKQIHKNYLKIAEENQLGGDGKICEIDESIFSHLSFTIYGKKYKQAIWVISAIQKNTGEIRIGVIPNRTKDSLNKFIFSNIKKGTKIITDGFEGYNEIKECGYSHEILNKSSEGLGKGEKVTSHIESVWSQLKHFARIYSNAISPENAEEYISEMWFRRECRRRNLKIYQEILQII